MLVFIKRPMTNKEFARVIERLQAKDIGALKILYEQFFKRIYYTALGVVKSEHDAYDIAMNVIMKLVDYPFINKMQVTAQGELLLRTDDSLVFTIIDGELETEEDYYFIKVQIEHNKNYEFGYKIAYQNLKNNEIINGWVIGYEQKSIDPNDLYVFYLHLQNNNGQVIYMEVHCFENDISYILNEFI